MDDTTYNRRVTELYERILDAADALDPDAIEGDIMGGRLDLAAADGRKCILTTQPAAHQVWVAGAGEGVHFAFDESTSTWRDEKDAGRELDAWVATVVRTIAGVELAI